MTRTLPEVRTTTVVLPGGRRLEVAVSGPDDGPALVFHHGTPGCALQPRHFRRACAQRGVRLVTFSRPGYAGSDRRPGRAVADVVDDVAAVADALGVGRLVTAGWSGGGPHALATAAGLADRVAAVLVIAGVAPYADGWLAGMGEQNVEEFTAALAGEEALRGYVEPEAAELVHADAAGVVAALSSLLPAADVAVLTDEVGEDMAAGMRASVLPVDGWVDDDLAFTRDWGVDLAGSTVPAYLWQGEEDLMVPAAHVDRLARAVPHAQVRRLAGEGHLSVGIGRMGEMLDEILGHL